MTAGRIDRINVSPGGVPKLPVPRVRITAAGLEGDRQNDLEHHGGPERAVCIWSSERLAALQAEGHPIEPGAAGENLTLAGLDWDALGPGSVLRLGPDAVIEVTRFTEPCGKIRRLVTGGDVSRIVQDRHPGWSRLYARVLAEGEVAAGDVVSVERGIP